jgi:hypothetical protein
MHLANMVDGDVVNQCHSLPAITVRRIKQTRGVKQ